MNSELHLYDVVLWPSEDGGVNAYGTRNTELSWLRSRNSTSRSPGYGLLEDLRENLRESALTFKVMSPALPDIDEAGDLRVFHRQWPEQGEPEWRELFDFLTENRHLLSG
jgi:glycosyltransferase A (GT-A) superfamily protein (DUF2064 family)